ncbi:MAG: hypothetical protein A3D64_02595 [Candidatus Wildermuthbacteria bacterium RIFCSPHIGHO2_02_FULL_49_9]|uniref:Transcriptional repressor PaaX-like central Cas2-like domain-containing protein n=2 Tax=Candidatus Wildermuthiibacteriota TaxID=1817923 RepID=A0A1G2QZB7_9BACT|nr:MAG: hypothetical protein A2672_03170 [Candidatus Wildermuthbacteria bacterium RIFCSPHIGHO2_01_FULL_49_22b]OHA71379.1 MAG: hypothetical protein A3D64_02595 [Candidatus Wildermuthbacteria bacterium RIFCSPHIGHO2_02_FULL_49_9]
MDEYKYYLRKPKSEIAKDLFYGLLTAGFFVIAASSPYFIINVINGFERYKKYPRKRVYDTFYQLRKRGLIKIAERDHQIYISLTEEGRKYAGRFQIDKLKIATPRKWDKRWRLLIFDIQESKRIYREALRGKLKQLGFYQLQKSVWAHAFPCQAEVKILKEFFGLSVKECRLVVALDIGDDSNVRSFFHLL